MKITRITDERIYFDNGNQIHYSHYQDWCESVYADFAYLEDEAGIYELEFNEELDFEPVEYSGFRFGNKNKTMIFVPCYNEQNGWYSDDLSIYYNGEEVLNNTDVYFSEDNIW